MTNFMTSGGARGSDAAWTRAALRVGHIVRNFTFDRHLDECRSNVPFDTIVVLDDEQLKVADPFLARANLTLERSIGNGYVKNLLRRNFYQIRFVNSVYAIGTWTETPSGKTIVAGGTSWAVQMFLDMQVASMNPWLNDEKKLVYFYDLDNAEWWEISPLGNRQIKKPPKPRGLWAGIGTRDLNDGEAEVINKVFE